VEPSLPTRPPDDEHPATTPATLGQAYHRTCSFLQALCGPRNSTSGTLAATPPIREQTVPPQRTAVTTLKPLIDRCCAPALLRVATDCEAAPNHQRGRRDHSVRASAPQNESSAKPFLWSFGANANQRSDTEHTDDVRTVTIQQRCIPTCNNTRSPPPYRYVHSLRSCRHPIARQNQRPCVRHEFQLRSVSAPSTPQRSESQAPRHPRVH